MRKISVSRENKNILKKGHETEGREKKQLKTINKISLVGVALAAIVFLAASIAGIAAVSFHMACFSTFMVVFVEAYEWIIVLYKKKAERAAYNADKQKYIKISKYLDSLRCVPFLLVLAAIVVSVSVISVAGKYFGEYTDIICAVTILGNILSLYFRLR